MRGFVLDASVALAWCFERRRNAYSDAIMENIEAYEVAAPSLWNNEIVNVLLKAHRTRRIRMREIDSFILTISRMGVYLEDTTHKRAFTTIKKIAHLEKLSFNDASCLELAMTLHLPLATMDKAMIRAARSLGVPLFLEQDYWIDYTPDKLVEHLTNSCADAQEALLA